MKYFLYLLAVISSFHMQSCSSKVIQGRIDMDDKSYEPKIYLLDPVTFNGIATSYTGKVIDSAIVHDDGQFHFGKLALYDNDYLYFLALQKKGQLYKNQLHNETALGINYLPIILNNDSNLELSFQTSSLPASLKMIKGDKSNEDLFAFYKTRQGFFESIKNNPLQDTHDENTLLQKENDLYNYQQALTSEAKQYNHFLIDILALRWASMEGNYERIPELVRALTENWKDKASVPTWLQQVNALNSKLPLTVGDAFPDYDLPMSDGSVVSLKKQFGKTITLVDMWASWCGPCRKENVSTLVPLWKTFHEDGLQIIGYALDADEAMWKKAINKDGADQWLHASHLRGDESPFFDLLKISTIPANFLLDADGIIIAKNLHGAELQDFVSKYLAKK